MSNRINKPINQWTEEQLVGWARGEIVAGRATTEKQLAATLAKKLNLEVGEDLDAFKAEAVAKADGGEAALQEPEVQEDAAEAEKAPEPVQEETKPEPAPEPAPTPAPTNTPPRGLTATVKQFDESPFAGGQKSTSLMIVEDNLAKYIDKMKPGAAHQGNEGPTTQVLLYRTIQTILRQKGSDFNFLFGELLKTVHKHRNTVFNERYVFRYMDRLSLTSSERRNFERFINMLLTVCDPATRSHTLKQVDVNATMEGFKDPDAHQRVVAFFQV